ncbi:MAG TPA: ATP-binding protein [Polyangiaceae bacterium]|nr:ATP-binding protein [Polyangiaceae bacterium]
MVPVELPDRDFLCSSAPPGAASGVCDCATAADKLESVFGRSQRLETLGRMTGAIAHDFNNLLLVVLGATELARLATRDPRVEVELGRIEEASIRAAGLVRQLLDFARGRPAERRPFRLGDLVNALARLLELSLGKNVRLETHVDEGLWSVVADPSEFEQVIMNLAINARDALSTEGGRVEIRVVNVPARHAPAGLADHVCLTVLDDGEGMSAEILARVFEPFFSTKAAGTGLGLATVRRIVERSHGTIVATSAVGRGTCFTIRLPRTPAADE